MILAPRMSEKKKTLETSGDLERSNWYERNKKGRANGRSSWCERDGGYLKVS